MSMRGSVVQSGLLAGDRQRGRGDGSRTLALGGHLVDLAGLAGLLDGVDDLDGMQADVAVAARTAAIVEGIAHISQADAAAGLIEAVQRLTSDI